MMDVPRARRRSMVAKSWSISAARERGRRLVHDEDARLPRTAPSPPPPSADGRCRARARAGGVDGHAQTGEEAGGRRLRGPAVQARPSAAAPCRGRCSRRRRAAAPGSAPGRWCGSRAAGRAAGPWISTAWPSTRISPESLASGAAQDLHERATCPRRSPRAGRAPRPRATSRSTSSRATTPGKDLRMLLHVQPRRPLVRAHGLPRAAEPWTRARRGWGRGPRGAAPRGPGRARSSSVLSASWPISTRGWWIGGERDVAQGGQRRVVVADEGDVVGHLEAALLDRVEGADGGEVVGGEDRRGPGPLGEQQEAAGVAAFLRVGPGDDGDEALRARGASWPPRTRGAGRARPRPRRRRCARCGDGRGRRSAGRPPPRPHGRRW